MATERQRITTRIDNGRHSLTSTTLVVLPEEYEHEYEEVLHGFRESFQPHGAAEDALVVRLAQAHWRSLRSRRIETGILSITAATEQARARKTVEDCPQQLNPHNAIAAGFLLEPAERWQSYLRYETAISRDFFQTMNALLRLQSARKPSREKPLARGAGAAPPDPHPTIAEVSDSGIRSVSQSPASPRQSTQPQETGLRRPAIRFKWGEALFSIVQKIVQKTACARPWFPAILIERG